MIMFAPFIMLCFTSNITQNSSCLLHRKSNNYGFYLQEYMCSEFEPSTEVDCDEFLKYSSLPDSIDWRQYGVVTPIKNQGHCGSCWTFSATGAMEGAWAKATGNLISLSEQQLVDCVKKDHGCNGGEMNDAFIYAIENPICTENQDPYKAEDSKCIDCNSYIQFTSCMNVPFSNELALKEAVAIHGPISVSIQADQPIFRNYKGGIITDKSCGINLDHGVLLVGYGEENGVKYWLVKNSWGTSWGENGYVRILRSDNNNTNGICGIAMQASFPIV